MSLKMVKPPFLTLTSQTDRRNWLLVLAVLICCSGLFDMRAASANVVVTPHVRAQLLSEVNAINPGAPFWVALHLDIAEKWHTYWKNAGDSGNAPTIEWQLPAGFRAGPIQWPYPTRLPVGPLMNYGYSGEAWMLAQIFPPNDIAEEQTIALAADVKWLVCKENCIPESGRLVIELPVQSGSVLWSQHAPAFERQRQRLPQPLPWPVSVRAADEKMELRIETHEFATAQFSDIWFYPAEYGWVEHAAEQPLEITDEGVSLGLVRGEMVGDGRRPLNGILVVSERMDEGIVTRAFEVQAAFSVASHSGDGLTLLPALLLALLGGLLLNVMPCVFPVLSIKAMAIVQQAQQVPRQVRLSGLAFTAGVLATFLAVAAVVITLRASGIAVGWGFQLQSPLFVLALAWLIFAMGLMLSGVWSIGGAWLGVGDNLAAKGGTAGSFFTGALAVVVATPCTAPFMGAAVGFALSQTAVQALMVFIALGLGMALPWLLLSYWPAVQRALPAPGSWMERVKQALAFPMYATAAWLVWVVAQQSSASGVAVALAGMLLIAFSAWLWQSSRGMRRAWRRLSTVMVLACIAGLLPLLLSVSARIESDVQHGGQDVRWEIFSPQRLAQLRAQGQPVLLNFTAAWCITCLVNEKVALSTERVQATMVAKQVVYLKGDWTQQDPQITAMLEKFGRSGVPLYVLYPRYGEPEVLPTILSESLLLERLQRI